MSSDDVAISIKNLSKCYQIYAQPRDRLKQFVLPRFQRLAGQPPKSYFNEFWALRDVSFDIKKGEVVGIIGRNGSGKSTLLQIICGTLHPTSGDIQTHGRIAALLELGSGFNPEFTGRENVYMNAAVLGLTTQEVDARFDAIASFAEIGAFMEQPVKVYSSGMMVRLAFAVAINVDPEILIVDEALSVGDELFQRKCFSRIEAIRANGATILFVSHSGAQIVELCDRAVLLDSGEQLASGAPKLIVGQYQKLLYAPADTRESIRAQIRGMTTAEEAALPSPTDQPDRAPAPPRKEPEQLESFDPNLVPTSTIEYESHGAIISSPKIRTLSGIQVNNLVSGRSYLYSYKVVFKNRASKVRFGMLIKTTSGLELGGGASKRSGGELIEYIAPGSEYEIEFQFKCTLNSGVYFMNSGTVGEIDGIETYLHRLIDVSMFRVLPLEETSMTGIVDFSCQPSIIALETGVFQ